MADKITILDDKVAIIDEFGVTAIDNIPRDDGDVTDVDIESSTLTVTKNRDSDHLITFTIEDGADASYSGAAEKGIVIQNNEIGTNFATVTDAYQSAYTKLKVGRNNRTLVSLNYEAGSTDGVKIGDIDTGANPVEVTLASRYSPLVQTYNDETMKARRMPLTINGQEADLDGNVAVATGGSYTGDANTAIRISDTNVISCTAILDTLNIARVYRSVKGNAVIRTLDIAGTNAITIGNRISDTNLDATAILILADTIPKVQIEPQQGLSVQKNLVLSVNGQEADDTGNVLVSGGGGGGIQGAFREDENEAVFPGSDNLLHVSRSSESSDGIELDIYKDSSNNLRLTGRSNFFQVQRSGGSVYGNIGYKNERVPHVIVAKDKEVHILENSTSYISPSESNQILTEQNWSNYITIPSETNVKTVNTVWPEANGDLKIESHPDYGITLSTDHSQNKVMVNCDHVDVWNEHADFPVNMTPETFEQDFSLSSYHSLSYSRYTTSHELPEGTPVKKITCTLQGVQTINGQFPIEYLQMEFYRTYTQGTDEVLGTFILHNLNETPQDMDIVINCDFTASWQTWIEYLLVRPVGGTANIKAAGGVANLVALTTRDVPRTFLHGREWGNMYLNRARLDLGNGDSTPVVGSINGVRADDNHNVSLSAVMTTTQDLTFDDIWGNQDLADALNSLPPIIAHTITFNIRGTVGVDFYKNLWKRFTGSGTFRIRANGIESLNGSSLSIFNCQVNLSISNVRMYSASGNIGSMVFSNTKKIVIENYEVCVLSGDTPTQTLESSNADVVIKKGSVRSGYNPVYSLQISIFEGGSLTICDTISWAAQVGFRNSTDAYGTFNLTKAPAPTINRLYQGSVLYIKQGTAQ